MDINPRGLKDLKNGLIVIIPFVIVVLVVCIKILRDWVAGDIQGRLIPATAIGMVLLACIVALMVVIVRVIFMSRPED